MPTLQLLHAQNDVDDPSWTSEARAPTHGRRRVHLSLDISDMLESLKLARRRMPSILQRSDYVDFLFCLKFGRGDPLPACFDQAYLDFKRTLRGIGKRDVFPRADEARRRADEALNQMITSMRGMNAATQKDFDEWHRGTCERLAAIYREYGYTSFHVGHAQKWLNMAFKYIYVLGEQRLPGFRHLYDLCHVPLDRILLDALMRYDFPPLPCPWSKLDDYDIYLARQRWVRSRFRLAPLDVEFLLWMHRPVPPVV